MSLLSWTAFSRLYREGKDCNPLFLEFKNGTSSYYQTHERLDAVKQGIAQKAEKNRRFLPETLDRIGQQLRKDTAELDTINAALEKAPRDLAAFFSRYWKLYEETIFGMAIDVYFDDIACGRIVE